jgi:hypothetical protein
MGPRFQTLLNIGYIFSEVNTLIGYFFVEHLTRFTHGTSESIYDGNSNLNF